MPPCRPANFSWVVEGLLAGSAFPSHGGHFQFLVDSGIQHLVTLTEYTPPLHLLPSNLKFHHIPVVEFEPPSIQQMHDVCGIVQQASLKKEAVVVHCYWGRGRTGTILAACLIALHGTKPEKAIHDVRRMRPYSIETYEQERIVYQFTESLRTTKTTSVQSGGPNNCSNGDSFIK